MKQLLVSIHDMMKQIVATQQANPILATATLSSSSSAPDTYGNPLSSALSSVPSSSSLAIYNSGSSQGSSVSSVALQKTPTGAPDSYGNPLASPISGTSQSTQSFTAGSSGNPSSTYSSPQFGSSLQSSQGSSQSSFAGTSGSQISNQPTSGYNAPGPTSNNIQPSSNYNSPQSTSTSSNAADEPQILSTYQQLSQLSSTLRQYRQILDERNDDKGEPIINTVSIA